MVQIIMHVYFIKPPGVNFLHAKYTHWLSEPKDQWGKNRQINFKDQFEHFMFFFSLLFQWHITVILFHWQLFYSDNSRMQNYLEDTISFYLSLSLTLFILSCWISIWSPIYAMWIIGWGWCHLKLHIYPIKFETFATLRRIYGVCEVMGFFVFPFLPLSIGIIL